MGLSILKPPSGTRLRSFESPNTVKGKGKHPVRRKSMNGKRAAEADVLEDEGCYVTNEYQTYEYESFWDAVQLIEALEEKQIPHTTARIGICKYLVSYQRQRLGKQS